MVLTAYRSYYDIDVQFENDILRNGISYKVFKSGSISKSSRLSLGESHIGEVNYNTSGIEYSSFKKGRVMKR